MYKVTKRDCPMFGIGPYVCEFICDTASDITTLPTSISEGTGGKTVYDNQKCASGSIANIAGNGSESKQYMLNNQDIWCPYFVATANNGSGSSGSSITIDFALSETSENPVANKVITSALNDKADINDIPTELPANGGNANTVNNHTVDKDVPPDAVFTDTVYDDTEIDNRIKKNTDDISQLFDVSNGGESVSDNSSYTLKNAVDYPLLGLNLYGKSVHDGAPSPENPVEIVSVGDSGSVEVEACGKNLFPWNDYTTAPIMKNLLSADKVVINSNIITVNIPQRVKTSLGVYIFKHDINKILFGQSGKVITLSCEVKSNYNVTIRFGTEEYCIYKSITTNRNRISVTFKYDISKNNSIIWYVNNASNDTEIQISNIQIEVGDTATAYEPYHGATANITSALPLCGIPVESGGNYTDSDGQQWVCDKLIYNSDGTGKIFKRVDTLTFDGSDDEQWSAATTSISGKFRFLLSVAKGVIRPAKTTSEVVPIICNSYLSNSSEDSWNNIEGISVNVSGGIYIYSKKFETSTLDEWKSWLASNPIAVVYPLNTPQEIELTAAEMSALRQLQTFNGITNISNDGGADMDVSYCTNKMLSKYVMPITTGLQKQIDEIKAAVLSLGGNV